MRSTGSRFAKLVWSLGILSAATWAFVQATRNLAGQGQQVFRVTTHLVELNVVVHDKQGQPVSGLDRSDFTLFDDGKKQQISIFSVESGHATQPPLEPLPANVFSNRLARLGGVPTNVTVILLDGLDTKFEDQAQARRHLIKFFTQIQPQDRVALYTLGNKLSIIQDFTSDPAPLLEALRDYEKHVPVLPVPDAKNPAPEYHFEGLTGPAALAGRQLDAGLLDAFVGLPAFGWPGYVRHAKIALEAFEAIANRLSGLPGHKSIVWMTGGYPFEFTKMFGRNARVNMMMLGPLANQTLRTAEALNRADVAIYPIDARGLFTDPAYHATARESQVLPRDDGAANAYRLAHSELSGMVLVTQGFYYIAEKTGGRAFYNSNDLKGSLRAALDDSEMTYTLGYYPNHDKWDGRYRLIKVKVDRKDVEVRHREGYFADSVPVVAEKDRVSILKDAAQSPLDATGVGLTVKVEPLSGPEGERLRANVYVDARDLMFGQDAGLRAISLDVWVGQYSNQGDSLGGTSKTIAANLKPEQVQKIMQAGGLDLTFEEKRERGAAELRVVVRDAPSGSLGSLKVPLHKSL